MMNVVDFSIFAAYFSIPIQILVALWKYPRAANMPVSVYALLVLFALFIFLCGAGHLMRCMELGHTPAFAVINLLTAVVSVITALYLFPMVPGVLMRLDDSLVRELKKLNEETNESKMKLSTFMAFLCHEVRNPLFAITSSATTLQEDTELTKEQDIAVGSIMDSAVLMLRLCNDVLDISKIDAGKLQLEDRDFDLHRMLSNLEHSVENQIAIKHADVVKFRMMVAKDVPKMIRADEVRLLQIVYNLLSNSIKFTRSGEIQLTVELQSERERLSSATPSTKDNGVAEGTTDTFALSLLEAAEQGCTSSSSSSSCMDAIESVTLKITVTDTGKGISKDRLQTIFEPYSQAKLSDYREHGGTGLGLSIISGLTAAMGGQISASSVLHVGSSFVVSIPVKTARSKDSAQVCESFTNRDSGADASERSQRRRRRSQTRSPLRLAELSRVSTSSPIPDSIYVADSVQGSSSKHDASIFSALRTSLASTQGTSSSSFQPNFDSSKSEQLNEGSGRSMEEMTILNDDFFREPGESDRTRKSPNSLFDVDCNGKIQIPLDDVFLSDFSTERNNASQSTIDKHSGEEVKKRSSEALYDTFSFPKYESVVLVVDDNEVNQKILSRMLQRFALEYRIAGNGQEAVDLVRNSRNLHPSRADLPYFALIFMDLSMPIKDGFEAIAELRQHGVDIPIVALTANALSQEKDRAAKAGATDFQTKPILRKDLHRLCHRYLPLTNAAVATR